MPASDALDRADLRGVTLDPEGPALVVEYGVPDQGGACLVVRFRLPATTTARPTRDSRYLHDPPARTWQSVGWSDLPPRVERDVARWLSEQERALGEGEREPLATLSAAFARRPPEPRP